MVINDNDMEESEAKQFGRMGFLLTNSARAVIGQCNASENVQVLRVRMKEHEITVVPGKLTPPPSLPPSSP